MTLASLIQLTNDLRTLYIKTAQKLKGSNRRQFMAEVVKGLGIGGQTLAERAWSWNRRTIRKGMQELVSGEAMTDGYERSGRKRVETKLPQWLDDIRALVDPHSQTDPSFKSTRLYTRFSVTEVRRQLIEHKGYGDEELPRLETIRRRLNQMGYCLKRVVKTKPHKRIAQTDAILEPMHQMNQQADSDPHTLRLAMDAKVAVNVGAFDRGGKTRTPTVALDHHFDATATLTPYGIFLPEHQELSLFFVCSKMTADCIVDRIEQWWEQVKHRFAHIRTLVMKQDNGPENHSRRTQLMYRMVCFARRAQLNIQLAY